MTNLPKFPEAVYSTLEAWNNEAFPKVVLPFVNGNKKSVKDIRRWNFVRMGQNTDKDKAIYESRAFGVIMVEMGNQPNEFFAIDEADKAEDF